MATTPACHQQQHQQQVDDLLRQLDTNFQTGLSTQQVHQRRIASNNTTNVVDPPVRCPAWICCLLPCLKSLPSRKAFAQIQPDDAQVKRNNKWMRYEASCLVVGDVIRLEAGDFVPADCVVVQVEAGGGENNGISSPIFVVDHGKVTGDDRQSWGRSDTATATTDVETASTSSCSSSAILQQLYWGGQVIQGSALAVVTAIGPDTFVAKLIQQGQFPVKAGSRLHHPVGVGGDNDSGEHIIDGEEGISLIATTKVSIA